MRTSLGLALIALCAVGGCDSILALRDKFVIPPMPSVSITRVAFVSAPSGKELLRFLCDELGFGLTCISVGPEIDQDDLAFVFDLDLELISKAKKDLPLASMLVAFRAFPDSPQSQKVGALCMSMCHSGQASPACASPEEACRSDAPGVEGIESLGAIAAGLLEGTPGDQPRAVAAQKKSTMTSTLSLDIKQIVMVFKLGADKVMTEISHGQIPVLSMPYEVTGSLWLMLSERKRMGKTFAPFRGEFRPLY